MNRLRNLSTPILVAAALLAAFPASSRAASGCGMDACPLEARGPGSRSRFSFDLAYQITDQDQLWNGSSAGTLGPTTAHAVPLETKTRAWVGAGRARITDWWAVNASLAYFERTHRELHQHHAGYFVPYAWNYSGVGDLMVTTAVQPFAAFDRPPDGLTVVAGAKLPTGRRHVDTIDGFAPGPGVRLGTGSVDALVGVQYAHPLKAPTLKGESVMAPVTLAATYVYGGKGTDGYRVGREVQITLDSGYPVLQSVRVVGQLSASFHGRDDVGTADTAPHHSGSSTWLATPGLRVQVAPGLSTYAYYQRRVYQRTNGLEAVAPSRWLLGTSYSIGR